jgi:hypothetical protein
MVLDHGILHGRCRRSRRFILLASFGRDVEMIAAVRRLGDVEAVVRAILHALDAFEKTARKVLRRGISVRRVVVVSVVGFGIPS